MKDLMLLLRVNALNIFNINRLRHTADKKEKTKASWALFGFTIIGLMMAGQMGLYSYLLASTLSDMGALSIMPGYIMMSAGIIIIFTTVYKSVGTLFSFRDYDHLMSLPIPTSTVVMSRILMLYGANLFFSMFVMIPSGIVYAIFAKPSFMFYPIFLICYLAMPMLPSVVACVFGLLIAAVSARFKYKNIAAVLAGLAAVVLLVVLSVAIPGAAQDPSKVVSVITIVSEAMRRVYPPSLWFTNALQLDIPSLLLYLGVSVGAFLLLSLAVGFGFKKINTALSGIHTSSNYRIRELKTSSPVKALYKKEISRYFASALYVTNTAVGPILLLLASAALFIMGPEKLSQYMPIPDLSGTLADYAPFMVSLFVSLSVTTAAAISIEGKQFWILKSLPVKASEIFRAKALVNLTLSVPAALIGSTFAAIALKTSALQTLVLFAMPVVYSLLTTYLGIAVNLAFPKFDWTSETQVIKQGTAVMISVFGNMALVGLPIFLVNTFGLNPVYAACVWTVVLFIAYRVILSRLGSKGAKKLLELNA
jgi:ABC-2 type transport system permease protein